MTSSKPPPAVYGIGHNQGKNKISKIIFTKWGISLLVNVVLDLYYTPKVKF